MIAYTLRSVLDHELHVFNVQEQLLRDIPGVGASPYKVSDQLIAYRQLNHLYVFNSQVQPLPGFPDVDNVEEDEDFFISNEWIGYRQEGSQLHLLNEQGQPLPGFTPLLDVESFIFNSRHIIYSNLGEESYQFINISVKPHLTFSVSDAENRPLIFLHKN